MNEPLQQFFETAKQLAGAVGYSGIRLGLVCTRTEPFMVLALSVVLIRPQDESPPLEDLHVGPVSAIQRLGSHAHLDALLTSLDSEVLEEVFDKRFAVPLKLKVTPQSIFRWRNARETHGPLGFGTYVEVGSSDIQQVLGPPDNSTDKDIAVDSNYAYASLTRLVRAYTGLSFSNGQAFSEIVLAAPWPVKSITARQEASRLRVDVDGISGLDTSRFILNVEGAERDQRLDSSTLRWLNGPESTSGTRTYTCILEVRESLPTAINLYLSRVPTIALRAEVQSERQLDLLAVSEPALTYAPLPHSAAGARLHALRIQSFRLLRSAELHFDHPFCVIVGPNQSGKSAVLDALQLLSDAARGELSDALVRRRGGMSTVQSRGASEPLRLEAELRTTQGQSLRFRLQLSLVGAYDFAVEQEELAEFVNGTWVPVLTRVGMQARLAGSPLPVGNGREALLSQLGGLANPLVQQAQSALAALAIYPYFRTGASWADPASVPMRQPGRLEPGARLEPTGNNLSAALYSLREERPEDWQDFVRIVRLAFPSMKDLRLPAVSRGTAQLFWDETNGTQFDASELSDGTLSFLSILCALFQPGSALIAVDEPEAHLHPDAILRLVGAARSLSERQPILFTTQSDALIGLLDDAPECVVVARREEQQSRLVRPEVEELREWLKSFSLREMRRELEGWGTPP